MDPQTEARSCLPGINSQAGQRGREPVSRTDPTRAGAVDALYTPLPEALDLLAERRRAGLPARHREWMPPGIPGARHGYAFLSRWFATPNHETLHFLRTAREHGLHPIIEEYHGDKFVGHNPLKHALGCLRFQGRGERDPVRLHIIDWAQQGCAMRHLRALDGTPLSAFHRTLMLRTVPAGELPSVFECSEQYERIACNVHAYYRVLLGMSVSSGILFEDFLTNPMELPFAQSVVIPAFRAVHEETGFRPLVVRLCPPETAHETWWQAYPRTLLPLAHALLGAPRGLREEPIGTGAE